MNNFDIRTDIWVDKFLPNIDMSVDGIEYIIKKEPVRTHTLISLSSTSIKSFFNMVNKAYEKEIFDSVWISNLSWDENHYYSISFDFVLNGEAVYHNLNNFL